MATEKKRYHFRKGDRVDFLKPRYTFGGTKYTSGTVVHVLHPRSYPDGYIVVSVIGVRGDVNCLPKQIRLTEVFDSFSTAAPCG